MPPKKAAVKKSPAASPAKKSAKKSPAASAAAKKSKSPAAAKRSAKHSPKIAQASMQELPAMMPPPPQQQQQQPMHLMESEELRQCRRDAYNKYLAKCDATCQKNVITPCIQSSVDQFHKLVMDTMNAGQMEASMASWPVGSLWDKENPPPTNAMGPKGKKVLHEYRRCINHTLRTSPEFDAMYQKQCGAHMTAPPPS